MVWEEQEDKSPGGQLRGLAATWAQEIRAQARMVQKREQKQPRKQTSILNGKAEGLEKGLASCLAELSFSLFLLHSGQSPPNRGSPVWTSFLGSTLS